VLFADDLDDESDPDLDDVDELEEPERLSAPAARMRDPRLRQVNETARQAKGSGSWWLGKDRETFSQSAATRAEQLKGSKAADKVKTPVNFV